MAFLIVPVYFEVIINFKNNGKKYDGECVLVAELARADRRRLTTTTNVKTPHVPYVPVSVRSNKSVFLLLLCYSYSRHLRGVDSFVLQYIITTSTAAIVAS